ncbi:MAG TPA: group 1 truncated hemoglobin [Chitinophagaceae bacterium]|jgi:hypothetical protein|nr:group 1 truncated hemoglobin [Chitinophagaceae bacterium]
MKTKAILFLGACLVIGASIMQSCKKDNKDMMMTTPTLYDSLGGTVMVTDPVNPSMKIEQGRLGIRSVVDSTIFEIAADTNINSYFKVLLTEVTNGNTSGFQALSKNLTDFFCVATGAKNFTYAGKDMRNAHDPATNPRMNGKAANDDFDSFLVDLVAGAKKNGLPDNLIARVGALVETLRSQVVQM